MSCLGLLWLPAEHPRQPLGKTLKQSLGAQPPAAMNDAICIPAKPRRLVGKQRNGKGRAGLRFGLGLNPSWLFLSACTNLLVFLRDWEWAAHKDTLDGGHLKVPGGKPLCLWERQGACGDLQGTCLHRGAELLKPRRIIHRETSTGSFPAG